VTSLEEVVLRDIRFLLKPHYETSRALIVGIDNYKNASPLSYAVNDASEVRDVLVNELEFPTENVVYLAEAEATRQNILRSFLKFTSDDIGLDERIFVFFAGHGHTRTGIRGEVGYLVAYDSDVNDFSTYIRWDDLTRNADLVRAKHMLFVMDACYGGLALIRGLHAGSARFLRDMMVRYSRQVLTAGKADELVADSGGPLPNHSIFTGHLIEGMRGKAATAEGVITASGLMAYVYQKVANDTNSNQTPHYGFFDGDGDFILKAPTIPDTNDDKKEDADQLIVIPFPEEAVSPNTVEYKVERIKELLEDTSSSIRLHDFLVGEVRHFLSETSDEQFPLGDPISTEELVEKVTKYDRSASSLSAMSSCLAYWAAPTHQIVIQKAYSRLVDRFDSGSGSRLWLALRWYPIIRLLYSFGISAIDGQRYDSLATILCTKIGASSPHDKPQTFIDAATRGFLDLERADAFKQLPGHERYYAPLSEYLFKSLQPQLDDVLFIGKNYERSFDEFEILLALAAADAGQPSGGVWGPIGRFGWKQYNYPNSPFSRIVEEAKTAGNDWPPLKNGLFGGNLERFSVIAEKFKTDTLSKLNWW
jgi:hypothetical protein